MGKTIKIMKKNKIIISANVLFTITNFRKNLIEFLINKKIEIVCVANNDDLSNSSMQILKDLNIRFIKVNISRKGMNPIEDLKYLMNLVKIYKREKPSLVMHFTIKPNIYGTIAAKIAGIPSINTINGLGSAIIKENFLSKILKYLYKYSLIFSTKVFFQNNDDLDFFVDNKLVNRNKTGIVPGSGVDIKSFSDCRSTNKELTFLLVSRLLKDKGIYEYIAAIKELNKLNINCKFLLAGQFDFGNPSAITKEEVKEWEDSSIVKFLGKTDNIKEFFKISDIIVLPSYREGLSRVLIEAASASKPIITSNVAGCKDIVDNGINGYLCDAKSVQSLSDSIFKIIQLSNEERSIMGEKSRQIAVKRFDKEKVNEIYFKEIKKICFM